MTALHEWPGSGLDLALPRHTHWDHVCGLLDLPGLPVHLHRREHDWVVQGSIAPVGGVREALRGRGIVQYELDGPPILTFAAGHDLFGDGSVVLVDLAGHTPGSVGVLAHTAAGWVLLAGDAAWHTDQIDLIRKRPTTPASSPTKTGTRPSGRCTACTPSRTESRSSRRTTTARPGSCRLDHSEELLRAHRLSSGT
ncbi:MBL fold metallo-hydrolase [Streptomyces sp. NPDC005566]|uniref:MBL fold metallo-hydrolase n=1 Tax=Streptomyces sp. NPDC005566 TaxID=3156886 RepID=UPI0033A90DC2